MNQGARDANLESTNMAAARRQEETLAVLKRIEALLAKIAENSNRVM